MVTKFTIEIEMENRWIPHFLSMLKHMEKLGRAGISREVAIYADGDGDFHPKFKWDDSLISDVEPSINYDGNHLYDAG